MQNRELFEESDDRSYKILTLLYYAYEGFMSCKTHLSEALRNGDEDTARYVRALQEEYRQAALKARRMLEDAGIQ